MRAAIVCVDFADILALTLPWNRHHFSDVLVITSPGDVATRCVAMANNCHYAITDAFYANGADFNKWAALEEGLDSFGRHGWITLMDADICWPKTMAWHLVEGNLYTPRRRMVESYDELCSPQGLAVPGEHVWTFYPLHPQQQEWAGFSQTFHCSDPALGPPPWHQTDWRHAGGADSFFQLKWHRDHKIRPPFECLHIGSAGQNWCGRAAPYLDGTLPEDAINRTLKLREYIRRRAGQEPAHRYDHERLPQDH